MLVAVLKVDPYCGRVSADALKPIVALISATQSQPEGLIVSRV
jgi:hypothetical protein